MVLFRIQHSIRRTCLVVVAVGAIGAAAWADGRAPEPDAEAQARAQKLVRDVYGKDFDAAKTSQEKTALARKLIDQAARSKGDPVGRFVLLRVARDVAVVAGDAETAVGAVERIVAAYDVDAMAREL